MKLDAGVPKNPRQRYFDVLISRSQGTFDTRQLIHQTVKQNSRPTESCQKVRPRSAACIPKCENMHFTTEARPKIYETCQRCARPAAANQNHRFTTDLSVRQARSDETVARASEKFVYYHSFERPTSTK